MIKYLVIRSFYQTKSANKSTINTNCFILITCEKENATDMFVFRIFKTFWKKTNL